MCYSKSWLTSYGEGGKKSIELHNKDMKEVKYEISERNDVPIRGEKGKDNGISEFIFFRWLCYVIKM